MAGTKRVINIGTNPDDGTGDLLRVAFDKINQNFDDVWTYTAVNSNLDITGDSINGTTDVIINPADGSAFKVTGDTIINPNGGNYNFTINGDLHNDVLYVQASTGRVGIRNTSPSVTFDVTGDAKVSGMTTANNLTVTGNTILGDANTDTITFNAKPSTHILPYSNLINLGASSNRWGTVYSTNLDVSGSISGTFTGTMTSTLTGNVNNTNVTTVNLAVTGPSNVHDLNVTGNLVVQGTTTTLETNDVLVNNQITFEGATADAHETILTVTNPTQDNTITFKNASGTVAFLSDVPTRITDLSDVDTSSVAPTNGQALVWNNADLEWQPGTVTGIAYTDLSVTTNPVGTASLIYNSINGQFTYTPPDLSGYLTAETSHADVLVDGDFSSAGIMKTDGAGTYSIATDNSANWDTAYGWGDHSTAGYQTTAGLNAAIDSHLNQSNPTSGHVLSWNGSDYAWVAQSSGSSYGDSDVATYLNGNLDSHIIPDTNDTYDIGSAEFKIRDLYVSDSSIKFVDNTDPLNPVEYPFGRDGATGRLTYNGGDLLDYNNLTNKPASADPTLAMAGNTGTGSVNLASETFTLVGTTGQINVNVGGFAASVELDTNITGLTTINTHTIPGGTGTLALTSDIPTNVVQSDTAGITGADQVTNIVSLTQAEYDAITPVATTVYIIVG